MAEITNVSHERIDDIPCVIGLCQQFRWVEVLNRQFGTHGLQQGLNNGQLCVGWLGYILSQPPGFAAVEAHGSCRRTFWTFNCQ